MQNTKRVSTPPPVDNVDNNLIEIAPSPVLPDKVTKSIGLGLSITELVYSLVSLFRRKPKV